MFLDVLRRLALERRTLKSKERAHLPHCENTVRDERLHLFGEP